MSSVARGKSIEMEDVKFHQCVRLSRFENDRTISFIPPDGEFELMSYRLSTPVKPLVWVEASVESHRGSRVEYMVKVRGQFKRRSTANNVEIYVPVPDDADSPKFRVSESTDSFTPRNRLRQMCVGCSRLSGVCSGEISICVEDQAVGRRTRLPDESALWSAKCAEWSVAQLQSSGADAFLQRSSTSGHRYRSNLRYHTLPCPVFKFGI